MAGSSAHGERRGQLRNLKTGDNVDVTYYESLLIKVDRPQK